MYRRVPITQWKGHNDSQPSMLLEPNSFKQITNWLIDKGRLQSFPKINPFVAPLPDEAIWGARTFLDGGGSFHTVMLLEDQGFYLLPTNPATYQSIAPGVWSNRFHVPYAIEIAQGQLFFTNGFSPLKYIIGDANWYPAGNAPGGSFFMGKLASHLLMVNTYENQLNFPSRIRYSASGNFLEWDSANDFTAGVFEIPDVEDQLTGFATIGITGFAFRNNGITAMSPTGVALNPFQLENFSIGPTGVGCSIPYTLANYGTFCVFVALNDIYYFDGNAPSPIGGSSKKSIFKDLQSMSSNPTSIILGTLGSGIDYLSYWLAIPQANDTFTSVWIYHFDDQTWVNFVLPCSALRTIANLATGVVV